MSEYMMFFIISLSKILPVFFFFLVSVVPVNKFLIMAEKACVYVLIWLGIMIKKHNKNKKIEKITKVYLVVFFILFSK
jgi:hypothetical protein